MKAFVICLVLLLVLGATIAVIEGCTYDSGNDKPFYYTQEDRLEDNETIEPFVGKL